MHIKMYTAIGIFLLIGLRSYAFSWIERELKRTIKQALICKHILIDRTQRLDRWQKMRPFIHYGYCSYARRLILEMIEAYEFLLTNNFESDRKPLYALRRLLLEFPPHNDPPLVGGSLLSLYLELLLQIRLC